MPNTRNVAIVKRGTDCFVVPATAVLDIGDKVRWGNFTGGGATVIFTTDIFTTAFSQRIEHTKDHTTGNPATGPKQGPYKVFCEVTNSFAIGNSDPEIIVF